MLVRMLVGGAALAALFLAWLWLADGDAGVPDAPPARSVAAAREPAAAAVPEAAARTSREPASPSSLPHTELPLRLVATVVRENPAMSLATVEDLDRTAHQVMAEGQSFEAHPRASVVRIERGRLILDNDGVREQLVLDRVDRAALGEVAPAEIAPEQREYRRDVARRLREISDAGEDYLDRGERTGLLAEGEVSPVYEDGELIGVRVDDVRAGGVYDRFGIRSGDVVTSINGVPLGSPTAAADVLTDLAFADVLEVRVERGDGTPELLQVPTAELQPMLEGGP